MDDACAIMYVSRMTAARRAQVFRETRFRVPGEVERAMGLWVDRIGSDSKRGDETERLRVLGQYAAVAVEQGAGLFVSPAAGRLRVRAGDVFLLFPDEPNRYHGAPAWTTRWIVWNGPEAPLVACHGGLSPSNPVVAGAAALLARAYVALQALMPSEDFPAVLERKRHLLGLLAELVRLSDPEGNPRRDRIANLVRDLSLRPGAERPSVRAMARECHLSAAQFRRRFRAHAGRSPLDFLTALRIADAKALLSEGVPMKDVATRTGFRDVFYFMRVFRKATGQTAGQFASVNGPAGPRVRRP